MLTLGGSFDIDELRKRLQATPAALEPSRQPPIAAVAAMIRSGITGGDILLIKRTEREGDPWSGQIAFPGGRKASNDQDYLETAMREAKEEVGIDLREHELLGQLPLVQARSRRVQVMPYVFQLVSSVNVRANREVAEIFWVPLMTLASIPVSKTEVYDGQTRLSVEAYVYNQYVIWGLTFRIINLLLDRRIDPVRG